MATSSKRKNPFTCGYEILGMFPIQVNGYEPYLISGNNQGIFPEFCLANCVTTRDEESAKQQLMERDHPNIVRLKNDPYKKGNLGTLMFPPTFLTKMPGVLNEYEFSGRRQEFMQSQGQDIQETEEAIPDYDQQGVLSGELTEKELYFSLKGFYEQLGDDVIILHSHFFLWNDNTPEKDFILINLSRGTIMVIEAKQHTKHQKLQKGLKQIEDARKRVEKLFCSIDKMSSEWVFVGVMYLRQGRAGRCCDTCPDFTIATRAEISEKLEAIHRMVNDENRLWVPGKHISEFIELCKNIFFTAQGNILAPVTSISSLKKINDEIEKTSEAKFVLFWTPSQMSIVDAMKLPFMMFLGFYGVGKTLLLKKRLNHLIKYTTDHIWFYINSNCKGLYHDLSTEFQEFHNNRIKFWRSTSLISLSDRLTRDGIENMEGQVHVLFDEYSLEARALHDFPVALEAARFYLSEIRVLFTEQ